MGVLGLLACSGRPRAGAFESEEAASSDEARVLEIDLSEPTPESTDGSGLLRLSADSTFAGLVRSLERARASENVKGAFVRLGEHRRSFTEAEELGRELWRFAGGGKPVVCHAHTIGNAASWLMLRGCTSIWLSPAGDASTVGIAAELVFVKGLLDRLKIETDFLSVGKYKSFAESLTREGPSDAAREALTETLDSIRQTWLDDVTLARPTPGLRDGIEQGPWSPEEARTLGMVDRVGFESEAREDAKASAQVDAVEPGFGSGPSKRDRVGVAEILRILGGGQDSGAGAPHIALVPALGGISMHASSGLGGGEGITYAALSRTLRRLAKDDAVKAVVLRIDSPGGSALASDLLWHELMELRKAKPVIASVGEMAASGGYYMACAAQRIVAPKTSIVGSIGVVGGKPVVREALAEIGVTTVTVPANPAMGSGARAGYLSPLVRWDARTRERVLAQMRSVYDLFVSRIAEARAMPLEAVRASAEGRIFSGAEAMERGLIDEFGGLTQALELARSLAELDADAPVIVEGTRETLLESLLLGDEADMVAVEAALSRFARHRALLLEQVPAEWLAFASALQPLTQGEQVLAIMPLGLRLR